MKLLMIGAGGVGQAVAMIIKRAGNRGLWLEKMVLADEDISRSEKIVAEVSDPRFRAEELQGIQKQEIIELIKKHSCTFLLNNAEPSFNEIIFEAAFEAGVGYMDCAMTLSKRHPEKPYELPYIKLGDYQFEQHEKWEKTGNMAIIGSGVEPGISDVFVRYAEKHLFDEIDEVNIRDGDNYVVPGKEVSFGLSIWTTIEECLNPPIIWEKDKGWFCTECFSEPEEFFFPGGIGHVEVINVEHEEVVLIPRVIKCNRVTFKYGVSKEFRNMLKNIEALGMDSTNRTIKVGDSSISPRDFLNIVAPSPLETAMIMEGKGCAGAWITGKKNGLFRSVYIYQIADNQECIKKYKTSSVMSQIAVGAVIMLDLVANGVWYRPGVFGPESFDPDPFMLKMRDYEFPAAIHEKDSEYDEQYQKDSVFEEMIRKF